MSETTKVLASLQDRVLKQLAFEYHDPDEAMHRFNTMTAAELLNMLSYIMDEDE